MLYEISNEVLTVSVDTLGAELFAITDRKGTQYLWQGDPAYWTGRAPVLFPAVGRLYEKTYTARGGTYSLGLHGFVRHTQLAVTEQGADHIVFSMTDTPETYAQYPYRFRFSVGYALKGNRLEVTFRVENREAARLDFGLGGHPGFRVPLLPGERFEDYKVVFPEPCSPTRVSFSDQGLRDGKDTPFALEGGDTIPLRHSLFDHDAIFLAGTPRQAALVGPRGPVVELSCPGMPYLGFWQISDLQPPFLCIEPWVSLPGRQDVREEFSTREDLIHLPGGAVYENRWTIRLPQA